MRCVFWPLLNGVGNSRNRAFGAEKQVSQLLFTNCQVLGFRAGMRGSVQRLLGDMNACLFG